MRLQIINLHSNYIVITQGDSGTRLVLVQPREELSHETRARLGHGPPKPRRDHIPIEVEEVVGGVVDEASAVSHLESFSSVASFVGGIVVELEI